MTQDRTAEALPLTPREISVGAKAVLGAAQMAAHLDNPTAMGIMTAAAGTLINCIAKERNINRAVVADMFFSGLVDIFAQIDARGDN